MRSICTYIALALSMWGCSGADGNPAPYAEDGVTSSIHTAADADAGETAAALPSSPPDDACEDEGATSICMAPIGARAGYVLCAQGERTCSLGHWATCVSSATSGPVSGWEPASVGCNAAPEPCAINGETRACVKQLPPTPEATNCYHGTETCGANVWGPCVP